MANLQGVTVQSVAKAADILECFVSKSELGISDISKLMGMSKSTIYGIVNTLVETGMLEQDSESRKYRLGLKLFELGHIVEKRMDIRAEAKPFCMALSEKYSQTVHLATHSEGDVVYIDKFDVPDFLIVYSQIGRRAPMTCTGVGKAMLAYLGQDYIEKYILSISISSISPRISILPRFFHSVQNCNARSAFSFSCSLFETLSFCKASSTRKETIMELFSFCSHGANRLKKSSHPSSIKLSK